MRAFGIFMLIVLAIIGLTIGGLFLHGCSAAVNTAHKAIDVVADQLDPATLLKKYEWFKDASAQCDKKLADIQVYENRFTQTKQMYGEPTKWPRDVREQVMLWQSEVSGITASYNSLAADYNAQMAKINYRFCNVGNLPQGATEPLPREYKPYQTK
jgi:hypothetical protein